MKITSAKIEKNDFIKICFETRRILHIFMFPVAKFFKYCCYFTEITEITALLNFYVHCIHKSLLKCTYI